MENIEEGNSSQIERKTHVIAVGNQKGGVGKTTNAVHMAAALGELGRKCLLIDLDYGKGTSTEHLGVPGASFLGSYEVLNGEEQAEDVIITNGEGDVVLPKNVDFICSSRKLASIELALQQSGKFRIPQDILINPLESLKGKYDYIFLDTAPNTNSPTVAAYKAARWFILAAMPSPLAISGLDDALADIQDAQRNGNPYLQVLGIVLAGVDGRKTRLATSLIEYVQKTFTFNDGSPAKFNTVISRTIKVDECQKIGRTLFDTEPDHPVTDQYRKIAKEIESRVNKLKQPKLGTPSPSGDSEEAASNG